MKSGITGRGTLSEFLQQGIVLNPKERSAAECRFSVIPLFHFNILLFSSLRVLRFLGLPPFDWHSVQLPHLHIGTYEGQMSEETRVLLRDFYEPHNAKLYKLRGHDFGW
jgi:hypothetical protein